MNALDVLTTPLEGVNLIEASAGTGKTYTLSLFALRFIVEHGYAIDEFLVVTYTRAATAELKERISLFISEANRYITDGESENKEIVAIIDNAVNSLGPEVVSQRVESALLRSDESQIFTIHSFCGRILSEFAFEASRPFDVETVEDQSNMVKEVAEDYWRSHVAILSPFTISLLERFFPLQKAVVLLFRLSNFPLLEVKYEKVQAIDLQEKWENLKTIWIHGKEEIMAMLRQTDALKASKGQGQYHKEDLEEHFSAIEKGFAKGLFTKSMEWLSMEKLEKCTKSKKETPYHLIFEEMAYFISELKEFVGMTKGEFLAFCKERLKQKKEKQGIQSQDDLITGLYTALISKNHTLVSNAVRGRYKAAMVDEFQDTDRVQFEIFYRLFSEATLFMIGDPKQAIYKFRGGDIVAYLHASKQVKNRYTLRKNYRSQPGLISAVNQIFAVENPFLYDEIHYEKKLAGAFLEPLSFEGVSQSAVTIWHDTDKKVLWHHFAEQILQLISKGTLGDESKTTVRLSHIAILTHTNKEAQEAKAALLRRGISAVVSKSGSIFKTYECEKLYLLLKLFLEPSRESLSRTLLVSKFFSYSHGAIEELITSDSQWGEWLETVYSARELLFNKGISQAVDFFLRKQNVYALLLSRLDGERAVTNIRHLLELLHQQEKLHGHEPEMLLHFLSDKMQEEFQSSEHELRLESEGDAVTIMTVHKSKGLQFPIVFHGLTGYGGKKSFDEGIYSSAEGMIMDVRHSEEEEIKQRCSFEDKAEGLRLFYVATTRAEFKLYLALVKPPKAGYDDQTPMGRYLHRNFEHEEIEVTLAPECRDTVYQKPKVETIGNIKEFPRNRRVELLQQVRSYTALTRGTTSHRTVTVPENPEGIFAFPRGPKAGTALHEIFEEVDFSRGNGDNHISIIVKKVMERYNYGNEDLSAVEKMVQDVLNKDLGGFSLATIPRIDRVTEMEFYLKADTIDEEYLQGILGKEVGHISKSSVDSFLNGFIDLLFRYGDKYYVLDWKSNYLGGRPQEYGQESLQLAMLEHNYHLQYLIYTTAVVQLLQQRMDDFSYEEHFGGVFYIFLRGIEEGESMNGIYYRKPKESVIQALVSHFSGRM